MKNRLIILFSILILTLGITGCDKGEKSDNSSETVLNSGAYTIEMDEARYYAYTRQASYEAYYIAYDDEINWEDETTDGVTLESAVKDSVLDDLCKRLVINSHAEEMGVNLNNEDITAAEDMVSEYFSNSSQSLMDVINITEDRLCEVYKSQKLYEKICDKYISDNNMNISETECAQTTISFITIEDSENGEEIAKKIAYEVKSGKTMDELAEEYGYEITEGSVGENNNDGSTLANAALSLTAGDSEWLKDDDKYYVIYCISEYDEDATKEVYEEEVEEAREKAADLMYEMWKDETTVKINEEKWNEISFDKHIF